MVGNQVRIIAVERSPTLSGDVARLAPMDKYFRDLLSSFHDESVEFLVVGAHALADVDWLERHPPAKG